MRRLFEEVSSLATVSPPLFRLPVKAGATVSEWAGLAAAGGEGVLAPLSSPST